MNSEALFSMALGLQSPWEVRGVDFKAGLDGRNELHIKIGFSRGAKFPVSTGTQCSVHDTVSRQWQQLSFLNIPATCIATSLESSHQTAKSEQFRSPERALRAASL
jgi:hypothetical protein